MNLNLKPLWAIFSARFRALLQYRAAALAGVGTQLFWGFIRVMIFAAFYASSSAAQPMTYSEVVTYVWLGQAMLLLVLLGPDADVAQMIRTGSVVYELARPIGLYRLWFARSVAARIAPTLLRMGPIIVIAVLFFHLQAPASPACAGLWLLSTGAAVLLASAMATLLTITLLWTISGNGINRLIGAMCYLFSGTILPLPLFPDWLQPLLNFLPFRGLMDTPFRIYMGHIPPGAATLAIGQQLLWVGIVIGLGRTLLGRGIRRMVAQGG